VEAGLLNCVGAGGDVRSGSTAEIIVELLNFWCQPWGVMSKGV